MATLKVFIIGAGLSGLSTAIALRKYCDLGSLELTIFERPSRKFSDDDAGKQRKLSELGAGVSLQSNGLRVLRDLSPELGEKVYASGFPCNHFKWKTAGNCMLGREPVNALPVSRPILIDCLMEYLPTSIFRYQTIADVVAVAGQKPAVRFADGSPDETADIVIGADGVGSIVRRCIFPDDQDSPEYLGHCAVGGILTDVPLPEDVLDGGCIKFFLGSTGAFGYTGLTQADHNTLLYFSVYDTELPDRDHKIDEEVLLKELRERHGDWADPMIAKCLGRAQVNNVYPIFVMPKMARWGRDGCLVIGDAAHALPSASGQGSSQALEDGQTLGLLLSKYLKTNNPSTAVGNTISALFKIRAERVYKIRAWAMAWREPKRPMSIFKTLALYAFLFVFVRLRSLANLFESVDSWDTNMEVEAYLESEKL